MTSPQPRYCPALEHLHNYVAAMEVELGRLLTEQRAVQRKLSQALTGRDELLRASGQPPARSFTSVAFGTQPLSPDLLVLTQAIVGCEQALAELKRLIDQQNERVALAHKALADYKRRAASPAQPDRRRAAPGPGALAGV